MSKKTKNDRLLIAVDTGGTFTDFFLGTPQGPRVHKVLSTPHNPALAIVKGIAELKLAENFEIIHGSTVATNAFLERKGARVALVTTAGFEDVIEIGRQNRPALYDLNTQRTPPLVAPKNRFGVEERTTPQGIQQKLTPTAIQALVKKLKNQSYDSLAICLLFSYANPKHENRLAQELKKLGVPISLSNEICPEYREYERTSTTCLNAYVAPIMSRYLKSLSKKFKQKIRVMQSNGGSLSITEASHEAIRTLLSGPAGGALGAYEVAKQAGHSKVMTLDMGGTSTDMALLLDGLELTTEAMMGGLPIKTPMIRIDTIGAGGGSIAWLDQGGALRVGPQSAGAHPGPLCYDQGGKHMTLTDAHVFLGRIPPEHFLGGQMKLNSNKITPILRKLRGQLKLSMKETAHGIITVANANMARALRVLSLERGYDPRQLTLLPFGGAGALHACELATMLQIPRVLIPTHPGILSAFGMAHADWVRDEVQTVLLPERKAKFSTLTNQLTTLKQKAYHSAQQEGFAKAKLHFQTHLDIRYRGQSYELTVPFTRQFKKDFERAHQQYYGFLHARELEIVNLRLQARVPFQHARKAPRQTKNKTRPLGTTSLYWEGKNYTAKVYDRNALPKRLRGPAIIVEYSATTFVPPGWKLTQDSFLNLVLSP